MSRCYQALCRTCVSEAPGHVRVDQRRGGRGCDVYHVCLSLWMHGCLPGWIDAEIDKMLAAGDLKQADNCGAPSCGYRVHDNGQPNSGIYNCWHNVTDEDFVVWMRVAALPSFKKLYRKIPKGALKKDTTYVLEVHSRFPVADFKGGKHFVLSTTSWIGGKNRCAMRVSCDVLVMRCSCEAMLLCCDVDLRQPQLPGLRVRGGGLNLRRAGAGVPCQAAHLAAKDGRPPLPQPPVICK